MTPIPVLAVGIAYRAGRRYTLNEILRLWLVRRLLRLHRDPSVPKKLRTECLYYALRLKPGAFAGGSIGNTTENDILKLYFNATTIANIAINASSSPLTALSVALHTGDPGEAGTQSTSEATYTSYARVDPSRDSGGWTVTTNSVSPAANIEFPAATGGSNTITHFSVGKTGGGATVIHFSGTVSPNIAVSSPVQPILSTSTAISLD